MHEQIQLDACIKHRYPGLELDATLELARSSNHLPRKV